MVRGHAKEKAQEANAKKQAAMKKIWQPDGGSGEGAEDRLPGLQVPDDKLQVPAAALRVQASKGDMSCRRYGRQVRRQSAIGLFCPLRASAIGHVPSPCYCTGDGLPRARAHGPGQQWVFCQYARLQ